jgi:hypothetical protein
MGEIIFGIFIGAGLVTIGRKVYRPVLKEVIKVGITASEAAKEALHEGRENLNEMVAEAKKMPRPTSALHDRPKAARRPPTAKA